LPTIPLRLFFADAIEDTDHLIVPTVCLYEVFKVVLREKGEDDALLAVAAMQQGTVIDLDADLAIEAASTAIELGLSLADSIIYTIAAKHHAMLWTQDAHFLGQPRVQYRAKNTG
jgi:predicted nucleic acid-binding protein